MSMYSNKNKLGGFFLFSFFKLVLIKCYQPLFSARIEKKRRRRVCGHLTNHSHVLVEHQIPDLVPPLLLQLPLPYWEGFPLGFGT